MPRRAAKKDKNHHEIVEGLRNLGWHVMDTSTAGDGVPDTFVGKPFTATHRGVVAPLEIKMPGEQLTEKQVKVKKAWGDCPYIVAESLPDALEQLAALMLKGNL